MILSYKRLSVLCLTTVVAVGGCGEPPSTAVVSEELERWQADNVIFGMEHTMTQNGVRAAYVEADTAFMWQDSTGVALRRLQLTIYEDGSGVERAFVTALRGTLDLASERMVAQDSVVLTVKSDGRIIESQELHYDPQSNRVWSDSAFVMYEGIWKTTGSSFESDIDFNNLRSQNSSRVRTGPRR